MDLTAVSETSIPAPSGLTEKSVTSVLDNPDVAGNSKTSGLKVYQVVAPGTHSGTVTVTTDVATYSYSVSNIAVNRSSIKTLNVNLASANATRIDESAMTHMLTARPWTLSSVTKDGFPVTQDAGNIIMFKDDQSCSFDCSAHSDKVYDYFSSSPDWVDPASYGYDPDAKSVWSISGGGSNYFLDCTAGAFPLVIVGECYYSSLSYEIVTLDASSLVLRYYGINEYTITFTGGGEFLERRLAKSWVLSSVTMNGSDWTYSAGDIMTLNSDKSIAIDCSSHGNKVYDYYYSFDWVDYSPSPTSEWSASELGGKEYLNFTEGAYPLVIIDNYGSNPVSYEIATLTETSLVLHHNSLNDHTICFTAAGTSVTTLLTSAQWKLAGLQIDFEDKNVYYDCFLSRSIGNIISFNANHSMSFDCSANGGYTDNYAEGFVFEPQNSDVANMSWSLDNNDTVLSFPAESYPIIVLGSGAMNFGIERINALELVLSFVYSGHNAKIVFTAV